MRTPRFLAGPIGLGAVLCAQDVGYREIFVSEPKEARLAAALRPGATRLDGSRRYATVIESSGTDAGRQQALELTAAHGMCVFLGESARWDIEETRGVRRKDFFIGRSFYFPLGDFAANFEILRRAREIREPRRRDRPALPTPPSIPPVCGRGNPEAALRAAGDRLDHMFA